MANSDYISNILENLSSMDDGFSPSINQKIEELKKSPGKILLQDVRSKKRVSRVECPYKFQTIYPTLDASNLGGCKVIPGYLGIRVILDNDNKKAYYLSPTGGTYDCTPHIDMISGFKDSGIEECIFTVSHKNSKKLTYSVLAGILKREYPSNKIFLYTLIRLNQAFKDSKYDTDQINECIQESKDIWWINGVLIQNQDKIYRLASTKKMPQKLKIREFQPIMNYAGKLQSRITLDNDTIIEAEQCYELSVGDIVEYAPRVKTSFDKFARVTKCPFCSSPIEYIKNKTYCQNPECPQRKLERIYKFFSTIGAPLIRAYKKLFDIGYDSIQSILAIQEEDIVDVLSATSVEKVMINNKIAHTGIPLSQLMIASGCFPKLASISIPCFLKAMSAKDRTMLLLGLWHTPENYKSIPQYKKLRPTWKYFLEGANDFIRFRTECMIPALREFHINKTGKYNQWRVYLSATSSEAYELLVNEGAHICWRLQKSVTHIVINEEIPDTDLQNFIDINGIEVVTLQELLYNVNKNIQNTDIM